MRRPALAQQRSLRPRSAKASTHIKETAMAQAATPPHRNAHPLAHARPEDMSRGVRDLILAFEDRVAEGPTPGSHLGAATEREVRAATSYAQMKVLEGAGIGSEKHVDLTGSSGRMILETAQMIKSRGLGCL